MSPTSYRLPDWLGGHTVRQRAVRGRNEVQVWFMHGDSDVSVILDPNDLVEVRPPSIDDPVTLPLSIPAVGGGGHVVVELPRRKHGAAIRVFDWDLDADGARALARAAWQRANAIEATQ